MNESQFDELLDRHYESIIGFHERRKQVGKDYVTYPYTKEEHHEFFKEKPINEHKIEMLILRIYENDNDFDTRDTWYIT